MLSSNNQSRGFATIAIIGGTVVAAAVGGIFYFLRIKPVEIDTAPKEDFATIVDDTQVLSTDAEEVLLRSLPRDRDDDYCLSLGLDRESCVAGVEDVCSTLFNNCAIDSRNTAPNTVRSLAEVCLVLRNSDGRDLYYEWLDGDTAGFFPLYYAIFGLRQENFTQKELAETYRLLLDARQSSSCDNREVERVVAEGYFVLSISKGRAMYDAWLDGGDGNPFPLYYAIFGLDEDGFIQDDLEGAYKGLLGQYSDGYYGSNELILQILTEAYMALRNPSSLSVYNGILDGQLLSEFPDISFNFTNTDLSVALTGLDLDSATLGIALSGFNLSPNDLGSTLNTLNLPLNDLGSILSTLNLPLNDLGSILSTLNLPLNDLGSILSTLNLPLNDLGSILSTLNLPLNDLGSILSTLNLPLNDLGSILSTLNLPLNDLGSILSTLNLPLNDLGSILSTLNLPLNDLGSILSTLNLPLNDLGSILSTLNLPLNDLGSILSTLNLPLNDLGSILSTLNLSSSDISGIIGSLNLSPLDLSAFIPNFPQFSGISPPFGDGGGQGGDALPVISISAVLGQIGVLSASQPTFRIAATKDGSVYTPESPFSLRLSCTQSVDDGQSAPSLIDGGLPTTQILSDSSATVLLQRREGVTGSVSCAILPGGQDSGYTLGSSSATISVVSGATSRITGPSPGLPSVSITALDASIDSGERARFRVSANSNLTQKLRVQYSCSSSTSGVMSDDRYRSEQIAEILGGSGGFVRDITILTVVGKSGYVRCSLLDDSAAYSVQDRVASVAVGLLRSGDVAAYDPTLPTVSLIAYRSEPNNPFTFSKQVSTTVVNNTDTYFGFVIDDPGADSFGTEVENSRVEVLGNELYVLSTTGFGATISALPDVGGAVKIGTTQDNQVPIVVPPAPAPPKVDRDTLSVLTTDDVELTYDYVANVTQYPWSNAFGFGKDRVVIKTYMDGRVVVQKGAGETVVCGYDDGTMFCATYRDDDGSVFKSLPVTVQCSRDFLDRRRDREVSGILTGGRYVVPDALQYGVPVRGYVAETDTLAGDLYQFILPTGSYISVDEGNILPIGIIPFLEPDATFSCEIVGGGEEDGYNVGVARAAVRVQPRQTVSIEDRGARRAVDGSDSFGEPVALIERGQKNYTFKGSPDFDHLFGQSEDSDYILDSNKSFGDVLVGLGKSLGVGFLTSFGGCVGSSLLNSGISALAEKLGAGSFGSVPTSNKSLDTKECSLDSAASDAAFEVLTGVARDYITWASEGFEDKPLFVANPTTFYKNFQDDVIGRTIDRSGLGFLCDIGFGGGFDPVYRKKIHLELQQKYAGISTKPRCTYSKLENNLEEYFNDVSSFVGDIGPEYIAKLGFEIDIEGTAKTYNTGNRFFVRSSDAGNQLDALSQTLERAMQKTQNSKNILLSIAEVDAAVSEATQDFAAIAKPVNQLFNPNNPMSVAAFRECTEEENPEGDADCLHLNVHGSQITDLTGKGVGAISDRLLHIDEFGEIGQLVKMAVNATSAGLMKKYLKNGFGFTVGRETGDLLSDIEDDLAASSTPYGVNKVGLSEQWWSVFFDSNQFYNNILSAELYMRDVSTLLQYIESSLYKKVRVYDKDGTGRVYNLPPAGPYTAFYTIHNDQKSQCKGRHSPCLDGYEHMKDFPQVAFIEHYNAVLNSSGDSENAFQEGWFHSWFTKDGWVRGVLNAVFGKKEGLKSEAVARFKRAYRFLSDPVVRQQYNTFIAKIGSAEVPYLSNGAVWQRGVTPISRLNHDDKLLPPAFPALKNRIVSKIYIQFPTDYDVLLGQFSHFVDEKVCTQGQACQCAVGVQTRAKLGRGAQCKKWFARVYNCLDMRVTAKKACVYAKHDDPTVVAVCLQRDTEDPSFENVCGVCDESGVIGGYRVYDTLIPFNEANPANTETYCPAHTTSRGAVNTHRDFDTIKRLRKIYEATLAVHIRLVGSVDEYAGAPLLDSHVHRYRNVILNSEEHSDKFERWRAVQSATLKKFRDGTMDVYIPVDDEFSEEDYKNVLVTYDSVGVRVLKSSCISLPLKSDRVVFKSGAFVRTYQRMDCSLGTVFQDQAFFAVRRDNADLSEPLTVYLACGYDDPTQSEKDTPDQYKRFFTVAGNPKPYVVTLEKEQDLVIFPVPKPFYSPFDSGDTSSGSDASHAGTRIRCSIDDKTSGIEGGTLTQTVTVSEQSPQYNTFHTRVNAVLRRFDASPARSDIQVAQSRVDEIAGALFYTYIWGWYTGFIEMPYYSIQGLLSSPPVSLTGDWFEVAQDIQENQDALRRYRLLNSLFADESDPAFESKNFGFLTPQEAFDTYVYSYDKRFDGYFGRALGEFLELVPRRY